MEQQAPWVHSCLSATELNKQHSARFSLSLSLTLCCSLSLAVFSFTAVLLAQTTLKNKTRLYVGFLAVVVVRSASALNSILSILFWTRSILWSLLPCSCLVSLCSLFFFLFVCFSLCTCVCACFLCYLCLNFIICLPSVGICRVH